MLKLDKKNQQLLAALIDNCRSSNSQLGKKIGVSREVIAYRIKKLEEDGIIKGYTADINFNKLGFIPYSVSIKLHGLPKTGEKNIFESLIDNKKIIFLQKTMSRYDFIFTILVKSTRELEEEMDSIRNTLGKNIKMLEIDSLVGDYDFFASFFDKKQKVKSELSFFDNIPIKLEREDIMILEELTINSRKSAVDISKKIKISVFAIANRIKKLVKNKIILAFRPIIEMERLGYNRYTLLANIYNKSRNNEIISFCRNHDFIWDIGKFVGNYNYCIEVYAENNKQFNQIVEEFVSNFSDSMIDYETLIINGELKHKYFFV